MKRRQNVHGIILNLCAAPPFRGSLRGPFEERGSDLERVFPRSRGEENSLHIFVAGASA